MDRPAFSMPALPSSTGAFTYDVLRTLLKPANATEPDPWGVNEIQESLEWTIPSPPPAYNFEEIPVVK